MRGYHRFSYMLTDPCAVLEVEDYSKCENWHTRIIYHQGPTPSNLRPEHGIADESRERQTPALSARFIVFCCLGINTRTLGGFGARALSQ